MKLLNLFGSVFGIVATQLLGCYCTLPEPELLPAAWQRMLGCGVAMALFAVCLYWFMAALGRMLEE
jgi:hypothetical protein